MSVIGQEEGIDHGTLRGYRQHNRRQVQATEECGCLKAVRDENAKRAAARKATPVERTAAQAAWYGGKFQQKRDPRDPSNQEKHAAALTVADRAVDAADCRELLAMLGLAPAAEGGEDR